MSSNSSFLCIVLFLISVNGHTYHSGQCPIVEPMQGFDMNQFLGVWYAVQKTSTASTCLIYNFTRGEEPGEYLVEQTSQHFALGLTPLKHEYSYTGELTLNDRSVPAKMTVRFPLSVAGSAGFTIFMTDYTTYAGVFTCQKIFFGHRLSSTILSRTRTLDKVFTDKVRTRLSSYSINPFDLSMIEQSGCPRDGADGLNINIDPNTLSSQNIGNAVRKVGAKVGDGVEYVIDSGKKVINKLSNSGDRNEHTEAEEPFIRGSRMMDDNNHEVEYLPF